MGYTRMYYIKTHMSKNIINMNREHKNRDGCCQIISRDVGIVASIAI